MNWFNKLKSFTFIKESQSESELDYFEIGHQPYHLNFSELNRQEAPTGKEKIWWIDKDWKLYIDVGREDHYEEENLIAKGRFDTHGKDDKGRVSIVLNEEIPTYRRERVYNKVVKILDKQFGYPELHRFSSFAGNFKTASPIIDNPNSSYGRIGHSWGINPENDEILWIINKDWKLETGRAKVHHNLWKDSDNIVASGRLIINRKTGNKTVSARIHDIYFQNKKVNKQREEYLKKRVERILDNGFDNPTIYHFSAGKIKIKEAQGINYMDVGHNEFRRHFNYGDAKENCNDKLWWIDKNHKIYVRDATGENASQAHDDFTEYMDMRRKDSLIAKGRYDNCGPQKTSRVSVNIVAQKDWTKSPLRQRKRDFAERIVTRILDETFNYPTIHITN